MTVSQASYFQKLNFQDRFKWSILANYIRGSFLLRAWDSWCKTLVIVKLLQGYSVQFLERRQLCRKSRAGYYMDSSRS